MTDTYSSRAPSAQGPARRAGAVTPDDGADLTEVAKALYVGGAGDLCLVPAGGSEAVTLKNHPVGYVAIQAKRVLETGTTATHIVALFD